MDEYPSRRVQFPPQAQKAFIDDCLLHSSIKTIAILCSCSERTIRDWRREKFLISEEAMLRMSEVFEVKIPEEIVYREPYWYVKKAAPLGGRARIEKHGVIGNSTLRLNAWRAWWDTKGRYSYVGCISEPIEIHVPEFNDELAEFCGIMMGDGGISERQVTITLHRSTDYEYSIFVSNLIYRLFGLLPSVYEKKDCEANVLVISRTALCEFLETECGLIRGNKILQGLNIPAWIRSNRAYEIACLRGLVDTDGCVFTHSYWVKGKGYSYKKLSFSSASPSLRTAVYDIFKSNGFTPRMAERSRDVRLDRSADMERYFELIGSHNPKHLNRYHS